MQNTAIVLMNLGSPESPTTKDLKPYLTEFLMDERVIDVPAWLRSVLVKGIIVPFRSPKSAAKYKTVWTKDGSPLIKHTHEQAQLIQQKFSEPVYTCMRYGNPATKKVLQQMHAENNNLQQIILLPLYPHYAMSSYETAVVQVKELHTAGSYKSELKIVPPFFNHLDYISALANSIKPYLTPTFDHILFSYHGIPERHVKKTDCTGKHCLQSADCCLTPSAAHAFCYRHQIITTTNKTAALLGLQNSQFSFSFQSRLGSDAWLKPYTVKQLAAFPKQGIKKLLIVCPAFVSDCLETLEEINEEGKELFLKSGGESFTMIPALNEDAAWIELAAKLIKQQMNEVAVLVD
jgi:protoporphyrin/coproporphyrin ferrochelatase